MDQVCERGSPAARIMLVIIAAFIVVGLLWLRNGQHADGLHSEAPSARVLIDRNAQTADDRDPAGRRGLGLYYSQLHGTLLMLLRHGTGDATGWVIKVTEQRGSEIVSLEHRIYERTIFRADEVYWAAVIARDGYMPLSVSLSIPAIATALCAALTALAVRLRKDGHDSIANRIEHDVRCSQEERERR
jgi:hypothetical protein